MTDKEKHIKAGVQHKLKTQGFPRGLIDLEGACKWLNWKNFADTAGVIGQLDLVISVDTSVAHLTGALGKPLWVLQCAVPDWQFQDDGVWYPSVRIFRQERAGDWSGVARRVREALNKMRV